jgi:hypothetical protein
VSAAKETPAERACGRLELTLSSELATFTDAAGRAHSVRVAGRGDTRLLFDLVDEACAREVLRERAKREVEAEIAAGAAPREAVRAGRELLATLRGLRAGMRALCLAELGPDDDGEAIAAEYTERAQGELRLLCREVEPDEVPSHGKEASRHEGRSRRGAARAGLPAAEIR